MRKILFGFLGIMMVVAVVASSARALFTSQATMTAVTFATGNADLQISLSDSAWGDTLNFGNEFFTGLYPSFQTYRQFNLKNNSSSNIGLLIKSKLKGGALQNPAGSWDLLKDVISVAFQNYDGDWSNFDGSHWSGWATLAEWNSPGDYELKGGPIAQGNNRWYRMYVKVSDSADDTIANKQIYNAVFEFNGTQAL